METCAFRSIYTCRISDIHVGTACLIIITWSNLLVGTDEVAEPILTSKPWFSTLPSYTCTRQLCASEDYH